MRTRGFEQISEKQFHMDCVNINVEDVKKPKRATAKSAGYDVFTPIDIILEPFAEVLVPTGIKSYMQYNDVLLAFPRSGLGFKYYCRLANTIGVIDCDYYNNPKNEGHIWIKIRNEGDKDLHINKGEAICQFIFVNYLLIDGDSFEGEERKGGFGSTSEVK